MREVRPGVWQLRVSAGTNPVTGKHRVVSAKFVGNKTAATKELGAMNAKEHPITPDLTVDELVEAWLEVARVGKTTVETYRYALKHLPAAWGARRADSIRTSDVGRLVRAVELAGVGADTVRKLHAVLSAAFTQAVKWDMLPRNPCRYVDLPSVNPNTRIPTEPELDRLFAAAADDLQETVFLTVAVVTGMRRGELCALRWAHVDFDNDRIQVVESMTVHGETKGTKTDDDDWLALDADTITLLRQWRIAQIERALAAGVPYSTDGYVLSDELDSSRGWLPNLCGTRFASIRSRAKVTGIRLHDLRHATASYLLGAGVDPKAVQVHMRHRRLSTTLNTYGKVLAGRDKTTANAIGQVVKRARTLRSVPGNDGSA